MREHKILHSEISALTDSKDALFRHAKSAVGRVFYISSWCEEDHPAIFSAFKIFQQLANDNYGKAYHPLSCLYRKSQDEKDEHQYQAQHIGQLAFEWSIANQSNQDVEVWCDLGEMYICGYVVERDANQAAAWWRKAAEQGFVDAQWSLGVTYLDGNGVAKDITEAEKWIRLAAEQGNVHAQGTLGVMYIGGDGRSGLANSDSPLSGSLAQPKP